MPIESLSLRTSRPQHDFVENAEFPPSTGNPDNGPQLNGHQPDANYAGAYHGPNYADYEHWAQYRDNPRDDLWYEGLPPPDANLMGQYTYQTDPNIGYPGAPGNAQHTVVPPGPSHGEYNIPPAHDIPSDGAGVRGRPPPIPDVADAAFLRSAPESAPSGMSAMEGLKRLSDRYLHDPGSQVHTLRMGLSPSGGRLRVMIMLDIDI